MIQLIYTDRLISVEGTGASLDTQTLPVDPLHRGAAGPSGFVDYVDQNGVSQPIFHKATDPPG